MATQVTLDAAKFERLFTSIERQMIMQSSFLESMYNIQTYQLELDKEREETRRREFRILQSRSTVEEPESPGQPRQDVVPEATPQQQFGLTDMLGVLFGMKLAGGQMFSLRNILGAGLAVALAGPIEDFLSGAIGRALENAGMDPSVAQGLGDALGRGAAWASIGRIFGKKVALMFGLAGAGSSFGDSLFSEKIFQLFDANEDGIINAFGYELDAQDFGNFGSVLGAVMAGSIPLLGQTIASKTIGLVSSYLISPAGKLLFSASGPATGLISRAFTTALSTVGVGSIGLGMIIAGGIAGAAWFAWDQYKDSKEFQQMLADGVAEVAKDPKKMGLAASASEVTAIESGATVAKTNENAGLTSYVGTEESAKAAVASLIIKNSLTPENVKQFFAELDPSEFAKAAASSTALMLEQKMLELQTMTPEMVANLGDADNMGEGMTQESDAQIRAYLNFMLEQSKRGDLNATVNYNQLVDILRTRGNEVSPEELIASGEVGYSLFGKLIKDYTTDSNTLSKPEIYRLNSNSDDALSAKVSAMSTSGAPSNNTPSIIAGSGNVTTNKAGDTNVTNVTNIYGSTVSKSLDAGNSVPRIQYGVQ